MCVCVCVCDLYYINYIMYQGTPATASTLTAQFLRSVSNHIVTL